MERLGRYELVARLAQGGMGEIFVARLEGAEGFAKLYAIKRILPQFANDGRFRKMLIGEAQIASKMAHGNICQVYELGETAGQLYIVMEYLEGVTLLPLLRACSQQQRPLELGFVAAVLSQVCDALHYAHELRDRDGQSLGVIHRDVSLANVFVCESGSAKVLDFGIAKIKDAQGTQTGTVKGKYAYMAPEQLRGEDVTRGVDVFSLGVVAYEMLSLRRLFQRQTDYLTFHAVLEQPIADLRRYRPDISPALLAVVMRALERDPTKRFGTVRELGTALADATGRPWAHDQIGQLVIDMFAEDSARRQAAVAHALAHPGTMLDGPPIASNASDDDDEDGAFPAVETEAGPISGDVKTVIERVAQQRGLPLVQSLVDIAPVAEPPPPARTSKWIWVVALLVLLTGGGVAVAFVMINNKPPEKVIIERSDSPNREKDMKRIGEHFNELLACANKHPVKDKSATVDLWIDTTGHVESARFEPDAIDKGPLGNCLRGVLGSIQYVTRNEASGVHTSIELPREQGTMKLTLFFTEASPFSQWYRCKFEVSGNTFNCAEQFMMHGKALLFDDAETAALILAADHPRDHKALGRKVKRFDDAAWKRQREIIVLAGNRAKFTQNEELEKQLLATAGTTLVEASPYDKIWGIGLAATDPRAQDPTQWKGMNLLGKILTQLRDELAVKNP